MIEVTWRTCDRCDVAPFAEWRRQLRVLSGWVIHCSLWRQRWRHSDGLVPVRATSVRPMCTSQPGLPGLCGRRVEDCWFALLGATTRVQPQHHGPTTASTQTVSARRHLASQRTLQMCTRSVFPDLVFSFSQRKQASVSKLVAVNSNK